jgi:hypothetical protein
MKVVPPVSLFERYCSSRNRHLPWCLTALSFGLVHISLACSGSTDVRKSEVVVAPGDNTQGAQDAGADFDPLYALMSNIYAESGDRTVYVKPFTSLDIRELSLNDAREFPGVANISAASGRLLVSSGVVPVITAFEIGKDLAWSQLAELSFAHFSLDDNANFFSQYRIDEHHMYLPFDVVKRIVWDPTDFEIEQVMEESGMDVRRGLLTLAPAGNRSDIHYSGPTLAPFFYHDEEWLDFGDASLIAEYDPVTHQESKVIEAPCPGLAIASLDEQGRAYLSPYDHSPLLRLYGRGPAPCVVRLTENHEVDDAFTTDFSQWTGGRYTNSFRYIRDGWGLAAVFHHERTGLDFAAEDIDPRAYDQIWEEKNWSVWRFDLERGEAAPYDAIDIPGFGWGYSQLDGRSFLMVYGETDTSIYELTSDGAARKHLEVAGEARWIKVR